MNLGDPELELIDPTPNVHTLFIHFDKEFFWTKLASRAVVRWSKRMYSCAGVCSYEGRGGLCDIALSEPLLKLRPRKDLIETLLHEMIHAFLFVTNRDQDRDGHGPNFQAHMHRINKSASLNISIYHSFHDEVELYQTHWWRCNGPCQTRRPHFGLVRRSANRAPGPKEFWWKDHLVKCGGTFVKIKEPEQIQKPKASKKKPIPKPNADITKYITNNIKTIKNVPNTCDNSNKSFKPVLKDSNNIKANTKIKNNSSSTLVISKKGAIFNPTATKAPSQPIPVYTGSGNTINKGRRNSKASDVAETVRNIWANKQISTVPNVKPIDTIKTSPSVKKPNLPINSIVSNPNKHKADPTNLQSPPSKIKKIDDYFKATSLLKDLYGGDYKLTQPNNSTKLVAVSVKVELVSCPICSAKFNNEDINRHLDECLNRDIIEKLSEDSIESTTEIKPSTTKFKDQNDLISQIPAFSDKSNNLNSNTVDLTSFSVNDKYINTNISKIKTEPQTSLQAIDLITSTAQEQIIETVKPTNNIEKRRRNTIGFITRDRGDSVATKVTIETDTDAVNIKPEPGSSVEEVFDKICPCCGNKFDKPVEEHLDECLVFFDNNTTISDEGASTSNNTTIVIDDDDDVFDETMTMNATGTKTPCPCCMKMIETADMNEHLDLCLQ